MPKNLPTCMEADNPFPTDVMEMGAAKVSSVNWDTGLLSAGEAQELSRKAPYQRHNVIWRGKHVTRCFHNGIEVWNKATVNTRETER